ncbi:MAG: monovalent cation/H+ antiporter subunit D family protein [Xanthomonadales bacterium]|jgi:multicomponent Na+:H+ antiporter subunit D|nr:monovalent cation/H+ antiporter subunit D family protein [Xanthomonadales bacterium]
MSDATLIALALLIPLAGSLGIALTGRFPNLRETVTLVTAVTLMLVVWSLLPQVFDGGRPSLAVWEMMPGFEIAFTVEPLGMLFAALASMLWIVNSVYSIGYMRGNRETHQTRFYACFAIALSAAMGVAFAGNLLTLFLFYEILTVSTYPLVAHKGDANTVRSARVYLGILMGTSIGLFLPAILWTQTVAGTLDFTEGGILAGHIAGPAVGLLLALYAFGIAKAAIMPVHRWLPAAMVAPTPVSALLHAVAVVKAGVFSITKVITYIFGLDFLASEPSGAWLSLLASFTILAASAVALAQTNLKRMLAYSTISQLSYIIMAAAVLKPLSEIGAAVHMVSHAFGKITLFFAAGAIYVASKKTELYQLHGIGKRMPWTMAAFTIGALSMIGVPPTAGFVSKWYILGGSLEAGNLVAVFTLIGSTVLNAAYFLPIIYRAWFRAESTPPSRDHGEAPWPMVLALTTTAFLTLAFFIYNQPVIDLESQLVGRMK